MNWAAKIVFDDVCRVSTCVGTQKHKNPRQIYREICALGAQHRLAVRQRELLVLPASLCYALRCELHLITRKDHRDNWAPFMMTWIRVVRGRPPPWCTRYGVACRLHALGTCTAWSVEESCHLANTLVGRWEAYRGYIIHARTKTYAYPRGSPVDWSAE